MKLSLTVLAFALCSISGEASAPAVRPAEVPQYEIKLDDRQSLIVRMSIRLPADTVRLVTPPPTEGSLLELPSCDGRSLIKSRPGVWRVPSGCNHVIWSAGISALDPTKFDVAAPASAWDASGRLWLLTNSLPWLRAEGQQSTAVKVSARIDGGSVTRIAVLPSDTSIPLAIVVGHPSRTFSAGGFAVRGYGHLPDMESDPWQGQLASILSQWRRDLLPPETPFPAQMSYVWLPSPAGIEPGLQASANSGSILMQYTPNPRDPVAGPRLKVGILMVGAHEGFHTFGAVRGGPAWANESLATYFAYQSAKRYLDPVALELAHEFVNARADRSLLSLQQAFEAGDGSAYPSFYGKGARFWAAIERVLTVQSNDTGRLAALIRQTGGLQGIDWSDGDRIAEYLDRYSNGRAGPVVRCYLIEDGCPSGPDYI